MLTLRYAVCCSLYYYSILIKLLQVLPISDGSAVSHQPRVTKWAEMLDVDAPLSDFHQQVPQMAFQWPFELDTFQKQAVLKLEQAESVFVAAHTSAGQLVSG